MGRTRRTTRTKTGKIQRTIQMFRTSAGSDVIAILGQAVLSSSSQSSGRTPSDKSERTQKLKCEPNLSIGGTCENVTFKNCVDKTFDKRLKHVTLRKAWWTNTIVVSTCL